MSKKKARVRGNESGKRLRIIHDPHQQGCHSTRVLVSSKTNTIQHLWKAQFTAVIGGKLLELCSNCKPGVS